MMNINVDEVLRKAEADSRVNEEPMIIITVGSQAPEDSVARKENRTKSKLNSVQEHEVKAVIEQARAGAKSDLVTQAWSEYHNKKLERKKLSSETFRMVDAGATKSELKEHYHKITELQISEKYLFDRARFIEQNGHAPETKNTSDQSLADLKDQRRKLVDQRCKLQAKLKAGRPKNPNRVDEWTRELDEANARYEIVNGQILSFGVTAAQ